MLLVLLEISSFADVADRDDAGFDQAEVDDDDESRVNPLTPFGITPIDDIPKLASRHQLLRIVEQYIFVTLTNIQKFQNLVVDR